MTPSEIDDTKRVLTGLFHYVSDKWPDGKWELFYADLAAVQISPEQARRVIEEHARHHEFCKYPALLAALKSAQRSAQAAVPVQEREVPHFEKQRAIFGAPPGASRAYAAAFIVARWAETCLDIYGHLPPHFWEEARTTLICDGEMTARDADAWMVEKLADLPTEPLKEPTRQQRHGLRFLRDRRVRAKVGQRVERAENPGEQRTEAVRALDAHQDLDRRFGPAPVLGQGEGRFGGLVQAMRGAKG